MQLGNVPLPGAQIEQPVLDNVRPLDFEMPAEGRVRHTHREIQVEDQERLVGRVHNGVGVKSGLTHSLLGLFRSEISRQYSITVWSSSAAAVRISQMRDPSRRKYCFSYGSDLPVSMSFFICRSVI